MLELAVGDVTLELLMVKKINFASSGNQTLYCYISRPMPKTLQATWLL